MTQKVPTYASDGRRLRAYSLSAIERLLSLSLIVVRRNRRGEIAAAHFRPHDGSNPLRATCNMGQRYVFLERVGNGRSWSHKRLIPRQDLEQLLGIELEDETDVDLYLRGIFRAVPLSCMEQPEPPKRTPAKVVSIDSRRRRTSLSVTRRRAA